MSEAAIRYFDGVALAEVENVLLVAWLAPPTMAAVDRIAEASLALARRTPTRVAHVNLVAKHEVRLLSDDVRSAILRLIRDPAHKLVASATIYGVSGFTSAIIQGVISGMAILSATAPKIHFVSTPEEAERRLLAALDAARAHAPAPGVIAEATESMRRDATMRGSRF